MRVGSWLRPGVHWGPNCPSQLVLSPATSPAPTRAHFDILTTEVRDHTGTRTRQEGAHISAIAELTVGSGVMDGVASYLLASLLARPE